MVSSQTLMYLSFIYRKFEHPKRFWARKSTNTFTSNRLTTALAKKVLLLLMLFVTKRMCFRDNHEHATYFIINTATFNYNLS